MTTLIKYLAILSLLAMAGCMQTTPYSLGDPAQEYFQRADAVTLSAGNAQEINTRIHENDPWPPYVGNAAIPGNGARMVGAAERYQDTAKLGSAPPPLPLVGSSSSAPTGTPVTAQ
jgi:hypothetical protein